MSEHNHAIMVIQCSVCGQLPELSEDKTAAHCANPACDEAGKIRPTGEWNAYHWPVTDEQSTTH